MASLSSLGNGQRLQSFEDPPLGRLDDVVDFLKYLVERHLFTEETERRVIQALDILREAIRDEATRAGA
jgi:hypothetical protein